MLDSFADDPRFVSLTLPPFSPSEHRSLVESLVGAPEGLRRPRAAAARRDGGQPVLHQGAHPLARRVGRHHAGRHRRLELLEGGGDLGRRPAGHDPAGRREAHRAAARGAAGPAVDRLGPRQDLRLAGPRDARRGRQGRRRRDRPPHPRGHPRGGARVPRRPADVRERHRARRPLRGALAPRAAAPSTASTPS